MVYRIFVEKKAELAHEAKALLGDAQNLLNIGALENVRIFNRYDAENITEELFGYAVNTVFSEPQLDIATAEVELPGATVFAVEPLPGQFDQRADSAAQCIQIISQGDRPTIRTAKVYALYGALTQAQIDAIKKYVINPVECREASLEKPETLAVEYAAPESVCQHADGNMLIQAKFNVIAAELFCVLGEGHGAGIGVEFNHCSEPLPSVWSA